VTVSQPNGEITKVQVGHIRDKITNGDVPCNEVSRNPQRQTQVATVDIHDRTCRRAVDKVQALLQDSVHPSIIQRYLSLWASWWYSVTKLERFALIYRWVSFTGRFQEGSVWLGRGILLNSPYYGLSVVSNQNH